MIKSITNFLITFFIFQQLKSQISQIDQNGYNAFCDETIFLSEAFKYDVPTSLYCFTCNMLSANIIAIYTFLTFYKALQITI